MRRAEGALWTWAIAGWLAAEIALGAEHELPAPPPAAAAFVARAAGAPAEARAIGPTRLRSVEGVGPARSLAIARFLWACPADPLAAEQPARIPSLAGVEGIGPATEEAVRAWFSSASGRRPAGPGGERDGS